MAKATRNDLYIELVSFDWAQGDPHWNLYKYATLQSSCWAEWTLDFGTYIPERDMSSLHAMGYGSGQMKTLSARRRRRPRRRRRHLQIQVDIQTRKLYLKVFLWFWGPGERYLRMETGVLHRISMWIS